MQVGLALVSPCGAWWEREHVGAPDWSAVPCLGDRAELDQCCPLVARMGPHFSRSNVLPIGEPLDGSFWVKGSSLWDRRNSTTRRVL